MGWMIATVWLSSEYLIALAAAGGFFLARAVLRRRTNGEASSVISRGLLIAFGVLGIAANVLFLLPLTVPDFGPFVIVPEPWQVLPGWSEYAIPAALGMVAQAVIVVELVRWVRRARSGPVRRLDPRPRDWWTLPPGRALSVTATLTMLTALTVVIAGLVAGYDEHGRSLFLEQATPGGSAATTFPGWYYGVPVLLAVTLLAGMTVVALVLLARPPFSGGVAAADHAARRTAGAQVVTICGAALALTLGRLLIFAAQGGSLSTQVVTEQGDAWFGTPYQAITPLLGLAGALLVAAGLAAFALLIFPPKPRAAVRVVADEALEA